MAEEKQLPESAEAEETRKKTLLRRKRIIAIISIAITVGLFCWLAFYISKLLFAGKGVREFKELIASYGNMGVLVAFAIQVLQVVVSPIPGEVVEIGMGVCFGWFGGTVLCLLGSALGAAIIFPLTKKFGVRLVELFVPIEKIDELKFINNEKKLNRFVFILYLLPGTPKDPLIFFFGLTRIKLLNFLIISTIARIPSVVSSTVGGKFIVEHNYPAAIILFVVTGLVSLAGMLTYQKILALMQKHHEAKALENEDEKNEKD